MIKLKSVSSVMNEIYDRIKENKPFDKELRPYSIDVLKRALTYFEERQDFEKCNIILKYIQSKQK